MLASTEHSIEEAEKFRHTLGKEMPCVGERFRLLIFVVKTVRDRMMRMLNLHHEIRHGELDLMRPEALAFIVGCETKPRAEVLQDVGSLADDQIAGFQKRRRELRMRDIRSF